MVSRQNNKFTKEKLMASLQPIKFHMDLAKMKRWHGAPPLLNGQNEKDFDAFILSLAECVELGDDLVACLVYRYGLEKWKSFWLISERSRVLLIEHQLKREFEKRDDGRKKHRQRQKDNAPDNADEIYEYLEISITREIIDDAATAHLLRNLHYKHKLDELSLIPKLNAALDLYAKIEAAINQSAIRLTDLDRQMALHDIFLAEKADRQYWDTVVEVAHPWYNDPI